MTLAQIVAAIAIPFLGLGATRLVTTDAASSAPAQVPPPPVLAKGFGPAPRLVDPLALPASGFSSHEPKAGGVEQLTKTTVPARISPKDSASLRPKTIERARTRP